MIDPDPSGWLSVRKCGPSRRIGWRRPGESDGFYHAKRNRLVYLGTFNESIPHAHVTRRQQRAMRPDLCY
jgi:hypothetical protein